MAEICVPLVVMTELYEQFHVCLKLTFTYIIRLTFQQYFM